MSTSNDEAPSSLVLAIERITTKRQAWAQELARRTKALEDRPRRARRRTWRETKFEILGHPEWW
jgi:hypothetical protein